MSVEGSILSGGHSCWAPTASPPDNDFGRVPPCTVSDMQQPSHSEAVVVGSDLGRAASPVPNRAELVEVMDEVVGARA
jgi:hypothetical protein